MAEKTADDIIKLIKDEDVEYVDIRFCDLPGVVQHFSIPASAFDESVFEDGLAFDGSSVRGFQSIHESDMMLLPDPDTARIDPFRAAKTLNLNFFVHDPFTREAYSRDPRNVARKAENYLTSTGIADTAYFGAEAEFYIFDSVTLRLEDQRHVLRGRLRVRAGGTPASRSRPTAAPTAATRSAPRAATSPSRPYDHYVDLRDEMATNLQQRRLRPGARPPRGGHRRPGRDQLQVQHAAARRRRPACCSSTSSRTPPGRTARPSPSCPSRCSATTARACTPTSRCGRTASRCSTTSRATPACRTLARHYIGGILHHAPSLLAFTNPTVNSYKRLVPGYEAPINLVYSQRNRSACVRIPITGNNPKAKRLEFRCPDSSGNPYLAFAAMLMAGLDGIKNKIEPQAPVDKDLYELPPEEAANIPQAPDLAVRGDRPPRGGPRIPHRGWRVHRRT